MVEQLKELENPTLENVSALVSAYHVSAPEGVAPSSRDSREGPSPITGEIRAFLDKTFGLPSIQEIYAALKSAEADSSLSAEVKEWAGKQREIMDHRSPTGMAVALANFKLAKAAKRLNTALENDILMATGFVGNERPTEEFSTGVTHLLIDKGKGRANWSPSDINDAKLTPKAIKDTFLDASKPWMSELPKLNFVPEPTTKEGADSTWGQFRRFGLPAEAEVKAWIQGEAHGSGAFKVREAELITSIVESRGEAAGARQTEITNRVKQIVAQHTKKDGEGYLDWVN